MRNRNFLTTLLVLDAIFFILFLAYVAVALYMLPDDTVVPEEDDPTETPTAAPTVTETPLPTATFTPTSTFTPAGTPTPTRPRTPTRVPTEEATKSPYIFRTPISIHPTPRPSPTRAR